MDTGKTENPIVSQKAALRREIKARIRDLDPSYVKRSDMAIADRLLAMDAYRDAASVFCFVGTKSEVDTLPIIRRALSDGKTLSVPLCKGERAPGKPGVMEARIINSLDDLKDSGMYGIIEPYGHCAAIAPADIDLAVTPCLACGRDCLRLGKGGGYYDLFLGEMRRWRRAALSTDPGPVPSPGADLGPAPSPGAKAGPARSPGTDVGPAPSPGADPGPAPSPGAGTPDDGAPRFPLAVALCREALLCDSIPLEPWDLPMDCVVTEDAIYTRRPDRMRRV
ncbi:MAG: 5-formyltetrahydrofolate cyclo-ligase [Lachnospiraceae bacterium]|jgi:5-formyltetrahydrofolate cyclo-ligase|nr:5-formyltetrahydrofolate cyclo-ligase [Lachnospiraceae bacterium]